MKMPVIFQSSWDVVEKPIYSNNQVLSGYKAIFRSDNNHLLNVCKDSYTPTTNERFMEVVQKMNDITGFPVKCFDEFDGGKKVLAFLQCTEPIQVGGHNFEDYLMIGNSHDSSTGFFMGNSNMMIRCKNRFSKVFRQLKVHHTKHHDTKIDQLLRYFETFMQEREKLFDQFERLRNVSIDSSIKSALVERLARMTQEEKLGTAELSTRKANVVNAMNYSIERECTDLGDNLFGLLNGITHYTTHIKKPKEAVFGNAVGSLARINEDTFRFCLEMA